MKLLINIENKDFENEIFLLHNNSEEHNKLIEVINKEKELLYNKTKHFIDINCGEGLWALFLGYYFKNVNIYEIRDEYISLFKKNKVLMDADENVSSFFYQLSSKNSVKPKTYTLDNFKIKNIGLIKITTINQDNKNELLNIIQGMKQTLITNNYPNLLIEDNNNNTDYIEILEKMNYYPVKEIYKNIILYKKK